MKKLKTILDTRAGEFEVYFDKNKWFYCHNSKEVEEIYQKALMKRGLGSISSNVEVPYNALLLSTITGTPKHFWYYCDEKTKAEIQKVLNEFFENSKPRLLEIRNSYLNNVNSKRLESLQEGKKNSRIK